VNMDDRRRFVRGLGLLLASPLVARPSRPGKVPRVGFRPMALPGPREKSTPFGKDYASSGTSRSDHCHSSIGSRAGRLSDCPASAEACPSEGETLSRPLYRMRLRRQAGDQHDSIVFAVVADAVGAGLIANFARPGGNNHGIDEQQCALGGKTLGASQASGPQGLSRRGLYNPADRSNVLS